MPFFGKFIVPFVTKYQICLLYCDITVICALTYFADAELISQITFNFRKTHSFILQQISVFGGSVVIYSLTYFDNYYMSNIMETMYYR